MPRTLSFSNKWTSLRLIFFDWRQLALALLGSLFLMIIIILVIRELELFFGLHLSADGDVKSFDGVVGDLRVLVGVTPSNEGDRGAFDFFACLKDFEQESEVFAALLVLCDKLKSFGELAPGLSSLKAVTGADGPFIVGGLR